MRALHLKKLKVKISEISRVHEFLKYINFYAKVDTATIHQGPPVPPATHQQVSNAGCNSIYAGSSATTAPLGVRPW